MNLKIGEWYLDEELGRAFKVLGFGVETVQVVDEFEEVRVVNRLMFESQCSMFLAVADAHLDEAANDQTAPHYEHGGES
jgi:hypothetical protein